MTQARTLPKSMIARPLSYNDCTWLGNMDWQKAGLPMTPWLNTSHKSEGCRTFIESDQADICEVAAH